MCDTDGNVSLDKAVAVCALQHGTHAALTQGTGVSWCQRRLPERKGEVHVSIDLTYATTFSLLLLAATTPNHHYFTPTITATSASTTHTTTTTIILYSSFEEEKQKIAELQAKCG